MYLWWFCDNIARCNSVPRGLKNLIDKSIDDNASSALYRWIRRKGLLPGVFISAECVNLRFYISQNESIQRNLIVLLKTGIPRLEISGVLMVINALPFSIQGANSTPLHVAKATTYKECPKMKWKQSFFLGKDCFQLGVSLHFGAFFRRYTFRNSNGQSLEIQIAARQCFMKFFKDLSHLF